MGISHKNLIKSEAEYVRTYTDIKGVDFSAAERAENGRLPYIENMYRDYDGEGDYIIESVPGFRSIFHLGARINSMFLQKISDSEEYIVVHAGTGLYRFSVAERDSGATLSSIATLKNTRSCGVVFNGSLYILDGENITVVSQNGSVSTVEDVSSSPPYIPTTYLGGEEYEQRNLLTDSFSEVITPDGLFEITHGTSNLKYKILSRDKRTCAVIGAAEEISGVLYIPSVAVIGNKKYTVTEISSCAFRASTSLNTLITNEGLLKIGAEAFASCNQLANVFLSDSVKTIATEAFSDCTSLSELFIGSGLSEVGKNAFTECMMLTGLRYADDSDAFTKITGTEYLPGNISYLESYLPIKIEININTPAKEITSLMLGEDSLQFSPLYKDGIVKSVIADIPNRHNITGKSITITGKADGSKFKKSEHGTDIREIFSLSPENGELIKKCTKAAVFDGRIFLSGNPNLPNTVFFSGEGRSGAVSPLYFGAFDYINDGVGGYPVISMLAAQDTLTVFKSGDDGNGSIFYHCREKGSSSVRPILYPVSYIHSGVCAVGDTSVFFDDPLFVSEQGICALDKNNGTLGRDVVCRSHNVNPKFLSEKLSDVRLTVWCGYLVAAVDTHIYLADSRKTFIHKTGGREYEWFYLNDVGYAQSNSSWFHFHSQPYRYYKVYEEAIDQKIPPGTEVLSAMSLAGYHTPYVYYAFVGNTRYHVYPTGEHKIDGFYGTSDVIAANELLFIGCKNGTICVFNNDKRGVAPPRLLENDPDFDESEFKEKMGRRIHSDFYDFCNIAPKYIIKTGWDNCDIPYLSKNTVTGSVTVKCKCNPKSIIHCESETDRKKTIDEKGFCASPISFTDFHFNNFSFDTQSTVTISSRAKERAWVEKQMTVYSDTFRAPMGIYSISYRFKVNGRIKK